MPDRAFDVGIAEQHAVTLSAGMATQGMKVFCNIYSSFMQRAYDQVVHDVAIQKLPVIFCLDRAGLVGDDGQLGQDQVVGPGFDLGHLGVADRVRVQLQHADLRAEVDGDGLHVVAQGEGGGEQVLARVLLHVVDPAGPVDESFCCASEMR